MYPASPAMLLASAYEFISILVALRQSYFISILVQQFRELAFTFGKCQRRKKETGRPEKPNNG